jgi:hypothetical protein
MPVSKHKFDWSMLDKNSIIEFVSLIAPKITNQEMTIAKFHRILASHLKTQYPIKVTKTSSTKVDFGWVYIGGTYYSDDDKLKKTAIEIVLSYNPFEEKIKMSTRRFKRMCAGIADTLLHEIMHMRQYRRRKFKYLPDYASTAEKQEQREEQSYLGNSDEIDAYSFNIACELMGKFHNDRQQVVNYLNEDQRGLRRRHNSWRMYLKAFDFDHEHRIIKRIKKKVVRYLPNAELGKPYRNKEWFIR